MNETLSIIYSSLRYQYKKKNHLPQPQFTAMIQCYAFTQAHASIPSIFWFDYLSDFTAGQTIASLIYSKGYLICFSVSFKFTLSVSLFGKPEYIVTLFTCECYYWRGCDRRCVGGGCLCLGKMRLCWGSIRRLLSSLDSLDFVRWTNVHSSDLPILQSRFDTRNLRWPRS